MLIEATAMVSFLKSVGLTAGDLNTNGMAVTCGSYSSNNSNVLTLS